MDQEALTEALERKLIGAAILDVLSIEPPASGMRLLQLPNCTAEGYQEAQGYQEIDERAAETDHASGQRHRPTSRGLVRA